MIYNNKILNLIIRFRKRFDQMEVQPEEQLFNFWVEYFSDACEEQAKNNIRFPVRTDIHTGWGWTRGEGVWAPKKFFKKTCYLN